MVIVGESVGTTKFSAHGGFQPRSAGTTAGFPLSMFTPDDLWNVPSLAGYDNSQDGGAGLVFVNQELLVSTSVDVQAARMRFAGNVALGQINAVMNRLPTDVEIKSVKFERTSFMETSEISFSLDNSTALELVATRMTTAGGAILLQAGSMSIDLPSLLEVDGKISATNAQTQNARPLSGAGFGGNGGRPTNTSEGVGGFTYGFGIYDLSGLTGSAGKGALGKTI